MISKDGIPPLQDVEQWSTQLEDFTSLCLTVDPALRLSASDMLGKLPFCSEKENFEYRSDFTLTELVNCFETLFRDSCFTGFFFDLPQFCTVKRNFYVKSSSSSYLFRTCLL